MLYPKRGSYKFTDPKSFKQTEWHTGHNNFLFADSHVKAGTWDQFKWNNLDMLNVSDTSNVSYNSPLSCIEGQPNNCGH